jgi:hypothetical protein
MTVRQGARYVYQTSLNEEQQEILLRLFEQGLHGNTHAQVLLRLIDESLQRYAENEATP